MNDYETQTSGLARRDLLKGAAAAPAGVNPIRQENAKPGTHDWLLTKKYDTAEQTSQHTRSQIVQP